MVNWSLRKLKIKNPQISKTCPIKKWYAKLIRIVSSSKMLTALWEILSKQVDPSGRADNASEAPWECLSFNPPQHGNLQPSRFNGGDLYKGCVVTICKVTNTPRASLIAETRREWMNMILTLHAGAGSRWYQGAENQGDIHHLHKKSTNRIYCEKICAFHASTQLPRSGCAGTRLLPTFHFRVCPADRIWFHATAATNGVDAQDGVTSTILPSAPHHHFALHCFPVLLTGGYGLLGR